MKILRPILFWPIIVGLVWYFTSFQVAVVVALVYTHFMILLLAYFTEKMPKIMQEQARLTDDALDRLHAKLMDEMNFKQSSWTRPISNNFDDGI